MLRAYCSIVHTVPDWSFLCISVTQQGSSLQISFSISRRVLFLFNEKKSIRIQSLDFLYTLHQKSLICSRKNQRNSLKHNAKHCLLNTYEQTVVFFFAISDFLRYFEVFFRTVFDPMCNANT